MPPSAVENEPKPDAPQAGPPVSDALALAVAPPDAARTRQSLGLVCALASATLYAVTTISAALTYDEGSNPATLILIRFVFSAAALWLAARLLRRRLTIPRHQWPAFLGTGFGVMGMTNGYLTSVAFIPIELAVIIFYSFPLLVGIAEAGLQRRRLAPLGLLCYLAAFGGLFLALGPSFDSLDWRGIALASLAAVSGVVTFLSSRKLAQSVEPLAVACWVNLLGIAVGAVVLFGAGRFALPVGGAGWLGLSVACFAFVAAFALQILSLRHAAAGPVAMMYNFEPALTVIVAWLLLGAVLTPGQGAGVALIIAALFVAPLAWRPAGARRSALQDGALNP